MGKKIKGVERMTENMGRFTTDKEGFCIIDFVGNEVWEGKYSDETKSLCNQLNNLCNENRELKKENKQLKSDLEYYRETYSIQEYGLDIETHAQLSSPILSRKELLKENERLKKQRNYMEEIAVFFGFNSIEDMMSKI